MNKYQPYAGRFAPLPQSETTRVLLVLGVGVLMAVGGLTSETPDRAVALAAAAPVRVAPQANLVHVTLPPVLVVGHREAPAAVSSSSNATSSAAADCPAPVGGRKVVVPS